MDVVIDVYDRASGEKVASQTVKRVYTHFSETQSFASAGSLVLPDDTIGFAYETEGNKGSAGTGTSATSALLQVRSKACATNYQPNSAGTACVACPAPSGTKQYRSGDCTIGTCGTGYKANAAKTGCEKITCPSGQHLVGDSCVADVSPEEQVAQTIYNKCNSVRDWSHPDLNFSVCCGFLEMGLEQKFGARNNCNSHTVRHPAECIQYYSQSEVNYFVVDRATEILGGYCAVLIQ